MELGFLDPLLQRPGPWASVYADESYNAAEDAPERRELTARAVRDELALQGADDATCDAVHEALAAPPPPGEPTSRSGRALFATGGEVLLDLRLAGPPRAPQQTSWSALPRLTPLLDGIGERTPCLVAYVDRTGADFKLWEDRRHRRLGEVRGKDWPLHRTGRDEGNERRFQLAVENTWEQNAEQIAKALVEVWEESGAELLLLVGDPRERHSVLDRLPEPIRQVAAETRHGGRAPGSETVLVDRDVAQIRAVHEADQAAAALERFREATPDGRAAAGVPALVAAAREHRIDTLLVHPGGSDLGRQVWAGPAPDQLAVRGTELRRLGGTEHAAPVRADDALLRAAAATGADVVAVRDADEAPPGGLGALLRWPEPDPGHYGGS